MNATTPEQDEQAERFEEALAKAVKTVCNFKLINPTKRRKGTPMAKTERQDPGKRRTGPKPKRKGNLPPSIRPPGGPKRKAQKKKAEPGSGFCGKSPVKLVIYGPSGVGKTSWGAHWPKPGFIIDPQEEGIRTLAEFGIVPEPVFIKQADTFDELLDHCADIATGKTGIQTAVFDSITGIEKLCFISHCEEYFEGDWSTEGFYSYQRGPKNAVKVDWPRFLEALDGIRDAGINVVLIGHSRTKPYTNPEGSDYDRFICYADPESWSALHRWAQAVLFYNYLVELDLSRKRGPRTKAKQEGEGRMIYTTFAPAYDAKNWYNLEPVIDGGESAEEAFKEFKTAFKKAGK